MHLQPTDHIVVEYPLRPFEAIETMKTVAQIEAHRHAVVILYPAHQDHRLTPQLTTQMQPLLE